MMKKGRVILYLLYSLPLLLLILVSWRLFTCNYSEFTAYLAASLQKPEWEKYIQVRFTASAFVMARWIIIILVIVYLAVGVYLIRKGNEIAEKLDSIQAAIRKKAEQKIKELNSLPRYSKWLLTILIVFVTVKVGWYIINWPLQYDEAWTYNYYIGNSFWQSILLPHNNHILFTAAAWFFHWLPVDPQISMRLPNLIAGITLILAFFFFIRRYISINAALISTCWLATCSPVVFYMLYARGYLFVILFTLLGLWLQLILIQNSKRKLIGTALLITIILGYWSNPVFLYAHAAIGLTMILCMGFQKDSKPLRQNIFIHLRAAFFVIVLYLPTLLSSHIHDLVNVGVKHSFEPGFIWKSFYNNSGFIFGFKQGYVIIIIALLLFIFYSFLRKRFDSLQKFVSVSFFVIFLFSILQSQSLSGHITIFFSISIAVMLAFIFSSVELKSPVNKLILILLLTGTTFFNSVMAHRNHWFNWSIPYDKSARNIAALMINKNIRSCYLTVNYYKPHLEYFYKIKGRKLMINLLDSVSQDFRDFSAKEQEMVITRKNRSSSLILNEYREFYKDKFITAYIRKDIDIE